MEKNKTTPYSSYIFASALIILFIARLFLITKIDLIPEEAYYWQWSRHPALSYYDMSPMVAYSIMVTTLFGRLGSQFFVRLAAPIISLTMSVLAFMLIRKITGKNAVSMLWAVLLNSVPILNIGSVLIVYGNLQMLFFSISVLFLLYFIITGKDYWWYFIGFSAGLALLSKYTAVFLYPIALIFLLVSNKYRHYLLRKEPYIAFLISMAIFSPVIIWNGMNDFVSFRHMLTLSGGYNLAAFPSNLGLFLGSQAGIISPFLFIIISVSVAAGFVLGLREKNDVLIGLSVSSLVPFAYFTYQCLKTTVQPNWPVFLYFPAFILTAVMSLRFYENLKSGKNRIAVFFIYGVAFFTGILFSVIIFIEPYHPILNPLVKIRLSKSPFRNMLGWRSMAAEADKIMEKHKKSRLLIAARRFQTASELAYYMKGKPQTYSFNYFLRNNEYSLWNDFKDKKGRNFLYVINVKYGKNVEKKLCDNFKSCSLVKTADIKTPDGRNIRTVKFYILKDFLYKDKYMFGRLSSKEF